MSVAVKRKKRHAPGNRFAKNNGAPPAPELRLRRAAPPDTAIRLISDVDRERIRSRLLADRAAYLAGDSRQRHPASAALRQIDAALLRLDTPEYGYCTSCGVRIATARLLELPYTEHCLVCWSTGPGRSTAARPMLRRGRSGSHGPQRLTE